MTLPPVDDPRLLRRAQRGDKRALSTLVGRWWPAIRSLALMRLVDSASADDAAQEAVIRWMRTLHQQDPSRPVGPWVRTIVRNVCTDHQRRAGTRQTAVPELETAVPDLDRALDLHASLQPILRALAVLPVRQRELIELCDRQGLTPSEAALELDISASAARSTLCLGRRNLRLQLLADRPELADLVRAS